MPPKRPSLLEEPPTASSSSGEYEEEEEEEEEEQEQEQEEDDEDNDDEGEEDDEQAKVKKPPAKAVLSPTPSTVSGLDPQSSDDEDDEESGTESGSDSEPSPEKPARPSGGADPNIKPISSKPMDEGIKSNKLAVKPSAASALSPPQANSRTATKRPVESNKDGSKEYKKRKEKPSDEEEDDAGESEDAEKKPGDDRKKQLFQRLWTEDDELAILKGMLDYFCKKGTDPSADMNAFHDFIKKSLHVEATRNQLADKIRRLKKKYQNNVGRAKDPVFSKPHEHKAFELSKKIWGAHTAKDVVSEQTASNGKLSNNSRKAKIAVGSSPQLKAIQPALEVPKVAVKEEKGIDWSTYPHLAEAFLTQKEGWMMHMPRVDSLVEEGVCQVDSSKLKELEQKWRNLRMAELDLFFKRMDLLQEQVKLFQDACNPKK